MWLFCKTCEPRAKEGYLSMRRQVGRYGLTPEGYRRYSYLLRAAVQSLGDLKDHGSRLTKARLPSSAKSNEEKLGSHQPSNCFGITDASVSFQDHELLPLVRELLPPSPAQMQSQLSETADETMHINAGGLSLEISDIMRCAVAIQRHASAKPRPGRLGNRMATQV